MKNVYLIRIQVASKTPSSAFLYGSIRGVNWQIRMRSIHRHSVGCSASLITISCTRRITITEIEAKKKNSGEKKENQIRSNNATTESTESVPKGFWKLNRSLVDSTSSSSAFDQPYQTLNPHAPRNSTAQRRYFTAEQFLRGWYIMRPASPSLRFKV